MYQRELDDKKVTSNIEKRTANIAFAKAGQDNLTSTKQSGSSDPGWTIYLLLSMCTLLF